MTEEKQVKGMDKKALVKFMTQQVTVEYVPFDDEHGVYVRGMTVREKENWEAGLFDVDEEGKAVRRMEAMRSKILIACLCDSKGHRLFDDRDILVVQDLPSGPMEKAYERACRLSGIGKRDIEDLTKN
jgi:hypothetical protein